MGIKKYQASKKKPANGLPYWTELLSHKEKVETVSKPREPKPRRTDICPKCHIVLTILGNCTNGCGYNDPNYRKVLSKAVLKCDGSLKEDVI